MRTTCLCMFFFFFFFFFFFQEGSGACQHPNISLLYIAVYSSSIKYSIKKAAKYGENIAS